MVTFGQDYTPIFKRFGIASATTAAAVWTPSTSTKIVLTDIMVANETYGSGTFQLRFGNVSTKIIVEGTGSSATIGVTQINFKTPIYNPTVDQQIFFEASITGSTTGQWTGTLNGFEQE